MKYDEALKRWGASKLGTTDWENVSVDEGTEGGCWGHDRDDYCYCESARAVVEISWRDNDFKRNNRNSQRRRNGQFKSTTIDLNLGEMIQEVLEIADVG